ncbi:MULTISPECIES: PrsW family intramembrane metalloprotease [unclassified Actinomyces]|uniref:PrsW family intramembrane metalloprotease n=1 Tax=unclassified Actinomyces TaxID=2609248 RepID=UPI001373C16D|nr:MULTISPECIES: PrsW family intramembrane metalloprotease [unclassified Actinomyces]MBW3068423.1 PrsW family intramembrane metalloprotease [Actinomyces sp. 594]NDR54705.1 PrsW family intramembrane metalloprotease [Actinomyces sp. 565]QHO90973.1 PrsW family intramembrane metalloprotease [Actinomyces sp. 432]
MSASGTNPGPGESWAPRPGYQRSGYPPAGSTQPRPAPLWTPQAMVHRHRGTVASTVLACVGALGLALMLLTIYASSSGPVSELLVSILLALVPLGIVMATVRWIDRWEPEPPGLLAAAFLWGAGVATVISLVVNTSASLLVSAATGSVSGGEFVLTVVSAPIIEEVTKGLGVLVIFLIWRRNFNGAVDGIVYAAVVAAGFAFAENILYFVQSSDTLLMTFLLRGIASPFAHVTFTACTGLAIGASARMRSPLAWVWTAPLGLAGAIVLHAFWNGMLITEPSLYFYVALPFFMAAIGLVLWLRWNERLTMRQRLADYQRAGWFSPAEVTMITTGAGRAAALRWARSRGAEQARAMREFLGCASALAQLRQQAIDGHADADFAPHEAALLTAIMENRYVFTR